MPRVDLHDITVGYGNKSAILKRVSTSLGVDGKEGKVIAIVGRSGSGKSSLLRVILGLDEPRAGSIVTQPANAQFAFLPQEPVVLEQLSIRENIYYFERIGKTSGRVNRPEVEHLSKTLGMQEIAGSLQDVSQLSGGEKQRVALLRALSVNPDILCLDEPCSGLDVNVKREFLIGLRTAVQSRSILTLYVTHHADEALMIADDVFFIERESTCPARLWSGSVPTLVKKPPVLAVRQFFGGATLNTLRCMIVNGSIQLSARGGSLGRLTDAVSVEDCWITFMPESIVFSDEGVPIEIIGTSAWFSFFRAPGEQSGVTLIGPGSNERVRAARLRGEVELFGSDGLLIRTDTVNHMY